METIETFAKKEANHETSPIIKEHCSTPSTASSESSADGSSSDASESESNDTESSSSPENEPLRRLERKFPADGDSFSKVQSYLEKLNRT